MALSQSKSSLEEKAGMNACHTDYVGMKGKGNQARRTMIGIRYGCS